MILRKRDPRPPFTGQRRLADDDPKRIRRRLRRTGAESARHQRRRLKAERRAAKASA